jgi:hypothetical protein
MEKLIDRLKELAARKERFTYDLRGNCQVYSGVVACYRATPDHEHFTEMSPAILHALEHDSVLTVWRDPQGKVQFDSCRVFTDLPQAVRFAAREKRRSVYNLNRGEHVFVDPAPLAA